MSSPLARLALFAATASAAHAGDTFTPYAEGGVPESVEALWAGVDPRAEPLDIEVVKEWQEGGVTTRYLIYTVCTHGGEPCRVAAFYTFPDGMEKGPALVWAHGGGQRADRRRGAYFAERGYATLDYNWGGREMVEGIAPNTDWGKLDPSQGPRFYPGALRPHVKLNLEPDEHTIDPVASPRNGNWFLLALAGRRAVTLLERQPEVDPARIGFTGYSMGGTITSYCAIDPRVAAAAPMVGGTGHLMEDFPGLPGTSRARQHRHPELFTSTMDPSSYWPLVKCPVLFLNATNDFHGIFDWSYRCVGSLPHDRWNATYNLHYNHSLRAEQYAALNVFFDAHLKGEGDGLPGSGQLSQLVIKDGSALFVAMPDPERLGDLASVEVLYSHDPNPRARHWRTATVAAGAPAVSASLPVRPGLPLLAFANYTYRLPAPQVAFEDGARPTAVYTITSPLATHYPAEIEAGALRSGSRHLPLIHDFRTGDIRGWGSSSGRRALRTYRFQDPARATPPPGAELVLRIDGFPDPLQVRVRIARNDWLVPAGAREQYAADKPIPRGATEVRFALADFRERGGGGGAAMLPGWDKITSLDLEIAEPKRQGRPIDLTREENREFLNVLVWE